MRNKLNFYERKDGQDWGDYIVHELKTKGAFYEVRYGDKYFKNQRYAQLSLIDITVGKEPESAETVITLMLREKRLTKLKDVPKEYLQGTLEELVEELKNIYGDKVLEKDKVTLLKLDDDIPCGCPPI